jgi:hypothetical protein
MLSELQRQFLAGVFDPENPTELLGYIRPLERLTPREQLSIYRGSVLSILTGALGEIYPVCHRLVGDAFFDLMAEDFIHLFPSQSPDLYDYGADFPQFTASFEPARSLPYLPDVAQLEWYWHRVFYGTKTTILDMNALAQVPLGRQGDIIFSLPSASALWESSYPIDRIWQVNQTDYQGDDCVDLGAGGVRLLIWRQGFTMRMDSLTVEEWEILKQIEFCQSFSRVCEYLSQLEPMPDITSLLPRLVAQGWIASFHLPLD